MTRSAFWLAAAGAAVLAGGLWAQCPADLALGNISIASGTVLYQATNSITASPASQPGFSVSGSASVQLQAGTRIQLEPGFHATGGGGSPTFRAFIATPSGCAPAPVIDSLSVTSGVVGTAVTINGSNFGATPNGGSVTFNGVAAATTSWASSSITTSVPVGATTGPVVVTAGGVASNGVTFTVVPTPVIAGLSTTSGPVGTAVTISGSNFGANQATSVVTVNGTNAAVTGWSAAAIGILIPAGATSGPVVATVNRLASNPVTFTVTGTSPSITGLSPALGVIGTTVTITGSGFGSTPGASTVTFNGVQTAITNSGDTSLTVTVPTGASTGPVVVTANATASNAVRFLVTGPEPAIVSVSPAAGPPGTSVTFTGTNFGSTQIRGKAWLGSSFGAVTSWSDTQIVATVAANATSGTAQIQQSGMWSNAVPFSVNTPVIGTVTPASGIPGTQVTVTGSGFGASQLSGLIWLGTATASVQT